MNNLFRFNPVARLRDELQCFLGDSKVEIMEASARSLGVTFEEYVEGVVTAPGGVADRLGRDSITANEIAETLKLSRIMDEMRLGQKEQG